MSIVTRKVDERVRVVLPANFKEQVVTIEEIGADEVRIKIVKPTRRRPALSVLLSKMTPENRHDAIDYGPPTGNEVL